jgi:hypothetical protein
MDLQVFKGFKTQASKISQHLSFVLTTDQNLYLANFERR